MQDILKIDTTVRSSKISSEEVINKSSKGERLFIWVGLSITSMFLVLMLLQDVYAHQEVPNSFNSGQVQNAGKTILPY